jgi:hypothetical protein
MHISGIEVEQFEACQKQGFVHLDWEEGLDEITGNYGHTSVIVGNKIIVRAFVVHKDISPPQTRHKKFEVTVSFVSKKEHSEFGEILYATPPHFEYNLECAFLYAQWQATLILRFIEEDIEKYLTYRGNL